MIASGSALSVSHSNPKVIHCCSKMRLENSDAPLWCTIAKRN